MMVRNGHFADVVKKCGPGDLREQRRFHVHGLGNRNGEGGHALAVAFGFGVLQVQRAAQGLQRVVIGLLELLESALELRRPLFDQLFEIALIVPILEDQAPVLERAPHAQIELVFFKGLQDVVVGARAGWPPARSRDRAWP